MEANREREGEIQFQSVSLKSHSHACHKKC